VLHLAENNKPFEHQLRFATDKKEKNFVF
jgi:hypothetical protein